MKMRRSDIKISMYVLISLLGQEAYVQTVQTVAYRTLYNVRIS